MSYSQIEGRVVRDGGWVAISHRNSNGASHQISSTIYYIFTSRYNVSMAWVAPEHVDNVLAEMARICCGQRSKKFLLTSLINVNLHEFGSRDGQ